MTESTSRRRDALATWGAREKDFVPRLCYCETAKKNDSQKDKQFARLGRVAGNELRAHDEEDLRRRSVSFPENKVSCACARVCLPRYRTERYLRALSLSRGSANHTFPRAPKAPHLLRRERDSWAPAARVARVAMPERVVRLMGRPVFPESASAYHSPARGIGGSLKRGEIRRH